MEAQEKSGMNTQPQRGNLNIFLAAIFALLVVAGIVLAALSLNMLWSLIVGIAVAGAVVIGLAWIGVNLFSRFTDAVLKREALRFEHDEHVMKLGYLPLSRGIMYQPIAQIEMPADVPVSLQGITAEQLAEFKIHAVNLLALSKQEMGDTSSQVIPFYRAKENDYFRDVAIWTNGVRYLIANKIAYERYKEGQNGRKKIGTFLNAGTVGQAFEALNGSG